MLLNEKSDQRLPALAAYLQKMFARENARPPRERLGFCRRTWAEFFEHRLYDLGYRREHQPKSRFCSS